jgi:hypothetical protein
VAVAVALARLELHLIVTTLVLDYKFLYQELQPTMRLVVKAVVDLMAQVKMVLAVEMNIR